MSVGEGRHRRLSPTERGDEEAVEVLVTGVRRGKAHVRGAGRGDGAGRGAGRADDGRPAPRGEGACSRAERDRAGWSASRSQR